MFVVYFQLLELLAKQIKGFKKRKQHHHAHYNKTMSLGFYKSNYTVGTAYMLAFPSYV